jgi:hypothetical protein
MGVSVRVVGMERPVGVVERIAQFGRALFLTVKEF